MITFHPKDQNMGNYLSGKVGTIFELEAYSFSEKIIGLLVVATSVGGISYFYYKHNKQISNTTKGAKIKKIGNGNFVNASTTSTNS